MQGMHLQALPYPQIIQPMREDGELASPKISQHTDVIHDIQYDYYGTQLATASSDRTIEIYDASGDANSLQKKATLTGHRGPVWMVSWANPRFGNVIASAGCDRKAIIWKESSTKQWNAIHVIDCHRGSVNAVAWAPPEFGPIVGTASSDGSVAVTSFENGCWQNSIKISNNENGIAHALGATSISFAPFVPGHRIIMLATGGNDHQVRLWVCHLEEGVQKHFSLFTKLEYHNDRVSDVAISPSCAESPYIVLASCHSKTVVICRKKWELVLNNKHANDEWEYSSITLKDPARRLSWSPEGELLLVSTAASEIYVLQEGANFTDPWIFHPVSM